MRVIALGLIQALTLWGAAAIIPGIDVPSFAAALVVVIVLAVFGSLIWPLITRLLLPLTVLTFGLLALVATTAMVWISLNVVDHSQPTVMGSFFVAVLMTVVSTIAGTLLDVDGDAYHLSVVRRRMRKSRRSNETDVPGVIFFEIDGLGEKVLRDAIEADYVPTIARWIADGSHRLVGWECDLSSQTGASQAGLLLGSNEDMPAFRWYEKERGVVMVSSSVSDTAEMERRRSTGSGLLAVDGTSRGNLLSGDAPRASATLSVVRDKDRSHSSEFFAFFSDPSGMTRTLVLSAHDIILEKFAYWSQMRSGAEHVHRGGVYPLLRAAMTVVMRELNTATLLADIVEGVPVSYSTYVGYDEVAHHSGIRAPDALAVLRRLDRQLLRLERATAQAPRPYHIVVLSDHGQTQGRPFRQRCGQTLEEVIENACSGDQAVSAPPAVAESWGEVGGWLTELSTDDSAGGRMMALATRRLVSDDGVVLGPGREAHEQHRAVSDSDSEAKERPEVIVLASGCLGLVSFPRIAGRMTLEQIELEHPGLVAALAAHPQIGWVMVRSEHEGAVVLGASGSYRLRDDSVTGTDPIADYGVNAASHLRRHDGFSQCPDLLIGGAYLPQEDEIVPFEEFMGSHGGLGGAQMHPFALVPTSWSETDAPIVGAATMHHELKRWMVESGLSVAGPQQSQSA
ncbi:MAG: phage holin family protein [Actinomycetes bacterium]